MVFWGLSIAPFALLCGASYKIWFVFVLLKSSMWKFQFSMGLNPPTVFSQWPKWYPSKKNAEDRTLAWKDMRTSSPAIVWNSRSTGMLLTMAMADSSASAMTLAPFWMAYKKPTFFSACRRAGPETPARSVTNWRESFCCIAWSSTWQCWLTLRADHRTWQGRNATAIKENGLVLF